MYVVARAETDVDDSRAAAHADVGQMATVQFRPTL